MLFIHRYQHTILEQFTSHYIFDCRLPAKSFNRNKMLLKFFQCKSIRFFVACTVYIVDAVYRFFFFCQRLLHRIYLSSVRMMLKHFDCIVVVGHCRQTWQTTTRKIDTKHTTIIIHNHNRIYGCDSIIWIRASIRMDPFSITSMMFPREQENQRKNLMHFVCVCVCVCFGLVFSLPVSHFILLMGETQFSRCGKIYIFQYKKRIGCERQGQTITLFTIFESETSSFNVNTKNRYFYEDAEYNRFPRNSDENTVPEWGGGDGDERGVQWS